MDKFKSINQSIFKAVEGIEWFDRKGIMKLDELRYIQFVLDDVGTKAHFNGYWVEVYNRNSGLISKNFFGFMDYMEFTGTGDYWCPYNWEYYLVCNNIGELSWYNCKPINLKSYTDILMNYIDKIK